MLKSFFIAGLFLLNANVFAQDSNDLAFKITSLEVYEVETPEEKTVVELPKVPGNPLDEIAMYLDGLIAIGKKIWPIIEAGRPVISTTGIVPSLSVLPHIEGNPAKSELYEMAGWSIPKARSFRVSYKNFFNSEVIGFTYTVFFQYNGSYKGKGKYLTSLKVQASEVYAAWGFDFDAASELINVANVGTDENPVASAIIQVSYKAKGKLNEARNAQSFYVDGNGEMQVLNK